MLNELHEFLLGNFKKLQKQGVKTFPNYVESDFSKRNGSTDSDYPELELLLTGFAGPQTQSSSSSQAIVYFDVNISTAAYSQKLINELIWAFYAACKHINHNVGEFEYKDTRPLTRIVLESGTIGFSTAKNNAGFSTIPRIRVELSIPNSVIPDIC